MGVVRKGVYKSKMVVRDWKSSGLVSGNHLQGLSMRVLRMFASQDDKPNKLQKIIK